MSTARMAHPDSMVPATLVDLADPDTWHGEPPYGEFARLRREAPVAWNERSDGHRGFWVVSRYDDIVAVSRDTATFSSRNGVISLDDFDDEQNEVRRTLLEMDPPQHTAMRKITSRSFTPRAINAFDVFVRATARQLIDHVLQAGPVDIVAELTKQLPILTLCRLLGVPDDRRDDMIDWSDALLGSDDPTFVDPLLEAVPLEARRLLPFGHPVSLKAFELGRALRADRQAHSADDVMTALALGEVDGRSLSDQEFCNYFLMLVVAGNETTRHSLTHGIAALADNPGEWQRFRISQLDSTPTDNAPIDCNVAAEEVLRWASAVHFVRRVATTDVELNGVKIAAGDKVAMYYVSGNRDEAYFERADRFIIDRTPNNHIAFGKGGPHFCIGAHVARLQVRIVLEELARRVESITAHDRPKRLRSNHINGVNSFMVEFS